MVGLVQKSTKAWQAALLCSALFLAGCSADAGPLVPEDEAVKPSEEPLKWQEGAESSFTYRGDGEIVRCWKRASGYDCLMTSVFDVRSQIPESPIRRSYSRFVMFELPKERQELRDLDVSDGYECSSSQSGGRSSLLEVIWKHGRVVEQSYADLYDFMAPTWTLEEVEERFAQHVIVARRLPFACSRVNEIATQMGIQALDSPLITYSSVMNLRPIPKSPDPYAIQEVDKVAP